MEGSEGICHPDVGPDPRKPRIHGGHANSLRASVALIDNFHWQCDG